MPEAAPGEDAAPNVGDIAYDTRSQAVARVMEVGPYRYALRPPAGGLEWYAPRAHVRPATASEAAAARATTSGSRP